MATEIRGLTLGISSNLSKLDKDVKGLNTSLKNTDKQLKNVRKLVKLDNKNVIALKQQQQLLTKSIEGTSTKLTQMRKRQEEANEAFKEGKITEAQYNKIVTSTQKVEVNLAKMNKELEKTNKFIRNANFKKFDELNNKIIKVGKSLEKTGQSFSRNLTAPILAASAAATKLGLDLDTSLRKVSTLFGEVDVDTANLRDQIQDLAIETGISATELSEGLYQALSAGIPITEDATEAISFLEAATGLAKAGFTTTEKAVDALTTVINAYGLEQSDVTRISDIFLATQNKGKTTVDELADSIAKTIPIAAALGVNFEDVAASLAGLTAQGIPTSEATTALTQLLIELGKEGTIASTILSEKTGKSLQELTAEGVGLEEVFGIILEAAKDNDQALIDLFGSVKAGQAFLGLTANEGALFASSLDAIENSSGATQAALERVNGPAVELQKNFQKLQVALQDLGAILIPFAVQASNRVGNLFEKFNALDVSIKKNIITIASLIAAIGPTLIIVGKTIALFGAFGKVINLVGFALKAMGVSMSFATAGIGILIAILVMALLQSEEFKATIMKLFDALQLLLDPILKLVGVLLSALQPILNIVIDLFNILLEPLLLIVNVLIDSLVPIIKIVAGVFASLFPILEPLINLLLIPLVLQLKLMSSIFGGLAPIISGLARVFETVLAPVLEFILFVINGIIDGLNLLIKGANLIPGVNIPLIETIDALEAASSAGTSISQNSNVTNTSSVQIGEVNINNGVDQDAFFDRINNDLGTAFN